MTKEEAREAVISALVAVMGQSAVEGGDPWAAAAARYPNVPDTLIAEAWAAYHAEREDKFLGALSDEISRAIDAVAIK